MDLILLFVQCLTNDASDYFYICQPDSTISQFALNICLHVQLHTYYNVFVNIEFAYSVFMNLRLHNNIHVCILKETCMCELPRCIVH